MSYDITFIKTKSLNPENVFRLLETTDTKLGDELYISTSLRQELISEFKNNELKFEVFQPKECDYFELNFSSYQVSLYDNQIALSIPYWDDNSTEQVNHELELIMNVLINHGFIGYDSQMGEYISEPFEIQESFTETKTTVDDSFKQIENQSSNTMILVSLGLGLIILTLAAWKFLKPKSK